MFFSKAKDISISMDEAKKTEKKVRKKTSHTRTLINIFRRRILVLALVAFVVTIGFFAIAQSLRAEHDAIEILNLNLTDIQNRLQDYSDTKLLLVADNIQFYIDNKEKIFGKEFRTALTKQYPASDEDISFLKYLSNKFDISEIVVVGKDGIISDASDEAQIGFDMSSGEQSSAFLVLNEGETQMAQEYQPMSRDSTQWRKYAGMSLAQGGFVQVAYDADKYHREFDLYVKSLTKDRRIGETGYIAVFDERGFAVQTHMGSPETANNLRIENIEDLDDFADGEHRELVIQGEECDCVGRMIEGYYFIAVLPKSETLAERQSNTLAAASLVALTVAAVLLVIFALIKGTILDNIEKLTAGLNEIAGGNLNVKLDAGGNAEFESLSKNINSTVTALKNYKDADAKRIEEELQYARDIQQNALPSIFPPYPEHDEFEIFATMCPAKEVGGDFFDFTLTKDRYLGFCVADVSGKGIPAALFMMRAKTLIRSLDVAGLEIEEILQKVNNELCTNNDAGMFVTCWLGTMDIKTGEIEYANAGHNRPVIIKADGSCSFINEKPNFVLGGMEGVKYVRHTIKLEPGDSIFVYSDGVTESTNAEKELYGDDRLLDTLGKIECKSCEERCTKLRKDIDKFVGDAPQFDDMTMLNLLYKGSDKSESRS